MGFLEAGEVLFGYPFKKHGKPWIGLCLFGRSFNKNHARGFRLFIALGTSFGKKLPQ